MKLAAANLLSLVMMSLGLNQELGLGFRQRNWPSNSVDELFVFLLSLDL